MGHRIELFIDLGHESQSVLQSVLVGFDAGLVLIEACVWVVTCHSYVNAWLSRQIAGIGLLELGFRQNVFGQFNDVHVVPFTQHR